MHRILCMPLLCKQHMPINMLSLVARVLITMQSLAVWPVSGHDLAVLSDCASSTAMASPCQRPSA